MKECVLCRIEKPFKDIRYYYSVPKNLYVYACLDCVQSLVFDAIGATSDRS